LEVTAATVWRIMQGGRARWKIENESYNVLKTNGYNLEHNFGHGQQNLSAILAILNLLAFACTPPVISRTEPGVRPDANWSPVRASSRTCAPSPPIWCFHPGITSWGRRRSTGPRRKAPEYHSQNIPQSHGSSPSCQNENCC
jgi:hypothetical protein